MLFNIVVLEGNQAKRSPEEYLEFEKICEILNMKKRATKMYFCYAV
jgi:hypothetical protein